MVGIFDRRPLCVGFCLFSLGALLGWFLPFEAQLVSFLLLLLCVIVLYAFYRSNRERRMRFFSVLLCAAVLFLSLGYSFLRIDLPARRAEVYEGEAEILLTVTEEGTVDKRSSEYGVLIRQINGESVRIRGRLSCGFAADFSAGDRVALVGQVVHSKRAVPDDLADGVLLQIGVEDPNCVAVQRRSQTSTPFGLLMGDGGIGILSDQTRGAVRDRLCESLGEEVGGLAAGFFSGDRSGIAGDVIRDFRRTGASHLMAVSGLHISILLGSVDLFLRKLFCPKKGRCLIVTLLSLLFLFLTGFSMSACRSVLMLYAVYLGFLFYEENDSLTSLFGSLAIILVLSPYGVTDLGLWMSFLATLGLLTVYPLVERSIPHPKKKKGIAYHMKRFGRKILLLAAMTVIATFFLLPILWLFFGELSLVSILSNLLLSPLSFVFLIGIPILLLTTAVPWLSVPVAGLVRLVGEGILFLLRWLSALPNVTLSLRYPFATPIVLAFTVWFAILLGVRLRKKWMIALPAASAVLAFAVCLGVYRIAYGGAELTYRQDFYKNEFLTVTEGSDLSICDRSSGSWSSYFELRKICANSNAGEIQTLVLTHYNENSPAVLESFMRHNLLRTLYLPMPRTEAERSVAHSLYEIAEEAGSELRLYENPDWIQMSESVWLGIQAPDEEKEKKVILTFVGEEHRIAYVSPTGNANASIFENDIVLVGAHGEENTELFWELPEGATVETIYLTSEHRLKTALPPTVSVYGVTKKQKIIEIGFPLS